MTHHEAWGGGLSVLVECTSEDDAPQVYAVHVRPHSHADRTYSHHWRQQSVISLSSRFFHDTRVAALGGIMVYVVTSPEAHVIWVLLQADGSQWSLVTQQVQHVYGFLPWMLFGRPPLLPQYLDLELRLYYPAVQNLIYGCGNVPQTTAESSDTPPIHCTYHVKQSVSVSNQLPTGLQCDPVLIAEVVKQ